MKIYIASSWKNQHGVEMLRDRLREMGHVVNCFVEKAVSSEGRSGLAFDVDAWIQSDEGLEKFKYDIVSAITADLVIYIGPSGCDAWAEVGAAWAKDVPVFALKAKGEQVGLMRRMALWFDSYANLLKGVSVMEGK